MTTAGMNTGEISIDGRGGSESYVIKDGGVAWRYTHSHLKVSIARSVSLDTLHYRSER